MILIEAFYESLKFKTTELYVLIHTSYPWTPYANKGFFQGAPW